MKIPSFKIISMFFSSMLQNTYIQFQEYTNTTKPSTRIPQISTSFLVLKIFSPTQNYQKNIRAMNKIFFYDFIYHKIFSLPKLTSTYLKKNSLQIQQQTFPTIQPPQKKNPANLRKTLDLAKHRVVLTSPQTFSANRAAPFVVHSRAARFLAKRISNTS